MFAAQPFDVSLVIVRRHQFVLAARKKRLKILQKFRRLGQPPEKHQPEFGDVAAQQNPVVDFVERLNFRIGRAQNFFEAERMERAEPNAFGALARGLHHAALHFARGFVREREPENIFARERRDRIRANCGCAR